MGKLLFLRRKQVDLIESPLPSDKELITAVYDGSLKQVKDFLHRGANPNAVESYYSARSALGIAAHFSRVTVVKLLVGLGVNVNHRDKFGLTPLHQAAGAELKRSLTITEVLLNHGADIDAKSHEGWTPLIVAVSDRQNPELVRLLLRKGADPTLRNRNGDRALDLVRPGKNDDLLKSLLEPVS